jgi:hypothetical protein
VVVDNTFLYVDGFSLLGSCQKDNLVDMGYVVHHRQEEWQTGCFTSQFHLTFLSMLHAVQVALHHPQEAGPVSSWRNLLVGMPNLQLS